MMKHASKIALAVTLVAIVAGAFIIFRSGEELTAKQILEQTAQKYADYKTYHDSGTVESSTPFGTFGTMSLNGTFTTAFVRPDRLRYEFKGKMSLPVGGETRSREIHYIVWRKGSEIYSFMAIRTPAIERSESLSAAVDGGAGISGGLATTPIDLLMPDESKDLPFHLIDLKEPARLEDSKVDGIDCYRITGKTIDRSSTIWIDKQTFLLRRMDWNEVIDNTTIWKPSINRDIPNEALEFNAPQ